MKYRVMKVFDCQDMPTKMCHAFLKMWDNKSNGSAVEWWIGENGECEASLAIEKWLIENGAKQFEKVMIKYWW